MERFKIEFKNAQGKKILETKFYPVKKAVEEVEHLFKEYTQISKAIISTDERGKILLAFREKDLNECKFDYGYYDVVNDKDIRVEFQGEEE